MEIRDFKFFLVLSDELHFGRAAARLHISQPSLSKRMAELERRFGVALFVRTPRGVEMTEDAIVLLSHITAAVDAFDSAVAQARLLANSLSLCLRLAVPPETSRVVRRAMEEAHEELHTSVRVVDAHSADQVPSLVSGEIDMGFIRLPAETGGLPVVGELKQELGVVMANWHPLVEAPEIRLAELTGMDLVMFPRERAPGLYDEMMDACRARGYEPGRVLDGLGMWEGVLNSERAFALLPPKSGVLAVIPGLVWRPVASEPGVEPMSIRSAVICRRATGEQAQTLRRAAELLQQLLVRHDGWFPTAVASLGR